MKVGALGWHHVQEEEERQRLKRALSISIGIHVGLVLLLVISPPSFDSDLPEAITVELVAGPQIAPPAAPKAAARRPSPPPKAAPAPPEPEPAAEPAPPPPPKAKAPVEVLPENESRPDKKVKQASDAKPKPAAKKPAAKPQSYDDVMKELQEENADDALDDLLEATPQRPSARVAAQASGGERSQRGVRLSPEMMDWMQKSVRLIQSKWVTPSNFRGRGLVTTLNLDLSSSGRLQGEPTITRSSGDPYFDDTAVAALISVGSLPPPPRAGRIDFYFSSDEE